MIKEGAPSKHFFLWMLIIIGVLSIIVVFPFLTSLVGGAVLAYIFYPVYKVIQRNVKNRTASALIVSVFIVLLITIPTIFLLNTLTKETHYMYMRAKQQVSMGRIIGEKCIENTVLCKSINDINELMKNEEVREYSIGLLNKVLQFITQKISSVILTLPKILIHVLIAIFTAYYLFKDGEMLIHRMSKAIPLKVHHQEQIIQQFADVTYAVIYGSIIVALIQGTLGSFGFWLFGIRSFIWWGVVMSFFALIPFIGTWVVWFPASAFLVVAGYLQGETEMIWRGIGLFIFGLFIISTIDNFLKPVIVAGKARVHPLLILVGVLGGLFTMGLIGLIVGPLLLALFVTLLEIYEKERKHHFEEPEPDILGHKNHSRR